MKIQQRLKRFERIYQDYGMLAFYAIIIHIGTYLVLSTVFENTGVDADILCFLASMLPGLIYLLIKLPREIKNNLFLTVVKFQSFNDMTEDKRRYHNHGA